MTPTREEIVKLLQEAVKIAARVPRLPLDTYAAGVEQVGRFRRAADALEAAPVPSFEERVKRAADKFREIELRRIQAVRDRTTLGVGWEGFAEEVLRAASVEE